MTCTPSEETGFALQLFGTFDVRIHGQSQAALCTRKEQQLLALLALQAGKPVQREWLAGMLWPDSGTENARANLKRRLTHLRQVLGNQAYRLQNSPPNRLSLEVTDAFVDVLAFDAARKQDDAAAREQVVNLYTGPLLKDDYAEWLVAERETRKQAYGEALQQLAEAALARQDFAQARSRLQLLLLSEPLQEPIYCTLMRVQAALGDGAALLQTYHALRKVLRKELNADPAPQTCALFAQLRQQLRAPSSPASPAEKDEELRPSAPIRKQESFVDAEQFPFLFRQGEWSLDRERGVVFGEGVHAYLLSAQEYGETPFTITARLRFHNYLPFQGALADTANAGIVLGWNEHAYWHLLFTGHSLVWEQVGSEGKGDAYRDFVHLDAGRPFVVEEGRPYQIILRVSRQRLDVFIDGVLLYSVLTPDNLQGKVGLRPWRARLECSFFEVQEDGSSSAHSREPYVDQNRI